MKTKPRIAITNPNQGGLGAWLFTALQIRMAGGEPIRVQPKNHTQCISFDALVIGGGTDIHPKNYKEYKYPTHPKSLKARIYESILFPWEGFSSIFKKSKAFDPERDAMELEYLRLALKQHKPILGICRGHQLVHTFFGSKLVKDTNAIYKERPRARSVFPRKRIFIKKRSELCPKLTQDRSTKVNAIHNQAILEVHSNFTVLAKESSGILQATESTSHNQSILTMQWHPEYLIYLKKQRSIFDFIVRQSKSKAYIKKAAAND